MKTLTAALLAIMLFTQAHADPAPPVSGREVVTYGFEALEAYFDGHPRLRGYVVALGFAPWYELYRREVEANGKPRDQFMREAEQAIREGLTLRGLIRKIYPRADLNLNQPETLLVAVSSLKNFADERSELRRWLRSTRWTDCGERLAGT